MITLGTILILVALVLAIVPLVRPTSRPVLHWAVILVCIALLFGSLVVLR
jgi:hypothetical protein